MTESDLFETILIAFGSAMATFGEALQRASVIIRLSTKQKKEKFGLVESGFR